jgi:hypothetical protein
MAFPFLPALAALGAVGSLFSRGRRGSSQKIPTMTPQQQQYQGGLLQGLGGLTPDMFARLQEILGGDDEAFSKFEAPYLRQFERDIIPRIAERFGGALGSHGALSSGGLNQALAAAGTDLSTNLASLRGGFQQQALSQLQGLMGVGLQPQFAPAYRPPTQGFLGGLAPGIGMGLGSYGIPALMGLSGGQGRLGTAGTRAGFPGISSVGQFGGMRSPSAGISYG